MVVNEQSQLCKDTWGTKATGSPDSAHNKAGFLTFSERDCLSLTVLMESGRASGLIPERKVVAGHTQ